MAYDNICKYLAEEYPAEFVRWISGEEATNIQVLKTELSVEPIRADSLTLLQTSNQILHLEFQTSPSSDPPLPFRMLDYWVRLKRQYWCPIQQVLIFLKFTNSQAVFTEDFVDTNTRHSYKVIRLWEEDPAPLLSNLALLPFAVLAKSDTPSNLLAQVAAQIDKIEEPRQKGNLSACVEMLAGLRFNQTLIRQLFREEIMRESVIYQDILQKGVQQGLQQGFQQGLEQGLQQGLQQAARSMIVRLLNRRFGIIPPLIQLRIWWLSIVQLEELGEALLNFEALTDLEVWLDAHPSNPSQS